ncbi:BTB/POZ [Penicillium camemberti]|uniref:BTB/POZ n=1 Tax=Penicillium camemberti (strain FM 013) TaxID=1429867 RepID=A0A0G4PUV1_PENC3|nr:BTB/POZ [Penicillium camemberti]
MNPPNQVIDPDGEVIIILRNADCPFAQPFENTATGKASDIPLEIHNGLRSTETLFNFSTFRFELPEQSQPPPEEKAMNSKGKKKKRKKERKYGETQTALDEYAAFEPAAEEESAAFEPTAEESAVEETATVEPTSEEPTAEEPTAEEPTAEEPAAEESAAEESAAEFGTLDYVRIQVSAKHLTFASSVFKKILTGGWKESITYLQKGSVEITAESWDTEAFLILLRAIHGQYYYIPRKLTLEMLAKVAMIADYYECKTALYIMKDIWIDNLKEKIPRTVSRDLILWLWIAWVFQLHSQFKISTLIAMSRSDDWVVSFGLPIPANVIDSINKCRENAIHNLVITLHEIRGTFLDGTRGCCLECRSFMYGSLSMHMQSSNLLSPKPKVPFLNLNYNDLVQTVLAFKSPRWYGSNTSYSSYRSSSFHDCPDASFTSLFAILKDPLEGLDLQDFTGSSLDNISPWYLHA